MLSLMVFGWPGRRAKCRFWSSPSISTFFDVGLKGLNLYSNGFFGNISGSDDQIVLWGTDGGIKPFIINSKIAVD